LAVLQAAAHGLRGGHETISPADSDISHQVLFYYIKFVFAMIRFDGRADTIQLQSPSHLSLLVAHNDMPASNLDGLKILPLMYK